MYRSRRVDARLRILQRVKLSADKTATVQMLVDAGATFSVIPEAREAPATILVGGVVEPILGVETLEAVGLTVDARRRRLTPSRSYAVRLGGYR
jgi:predicted aspartyl protease